MLHTRLIFALIAVVGALAVAGQTRADDAPVVYASNYPLFYFAQEIAGGELDIRLPAIEGDPAFWAPDGDQVAALQAADLVLLNGAGYEGWLNFVSLREERLVDTTAGLADRLLPLEEATVHQHGPEGEHSHAGTAFTTWLDPGLAAAQARAIAAALVDRAGESYVDPFEIAETFSRAGMVDEALLWLDQAVEYGSYEMTYIAFWPHLDVVRDDLQYEVLLKRVYGDKVEEIRRVADSLRSRDR